MADLPTRSFSTITSTIVAGIQGRASQLIDFGRGSPLLAIVRGFGEVFLWFQALALKVLKASRLSTSQGNDVDTFAADFMPPVEGTDSPRLGAQASAGVLTFARFTAGASTCFIPVGATAQTADGTQNYIVTADPTYPTYSATPTPGYTLAAAVASIDVPAKAVVAGSAGNVALGTITVMTSPITGIDSVINGAAFSAGIDSELDDSLKKRFSDYILGLSRGDRYGLASSIEGTQVKVDWALVESYDLSGAWHPGFFFVVCDDGSGAPSSDFVQMVRDAAEAVRPLGIQCAVFPVTVVNVTVSLSISTAAGFDHNVVVGLVANAITTGINSLGIGNALDFNRIAAWAYSVPGVTGVTATRLNGNFGDGASVQATKRTLDSLYDMPIYSLKCYSCVVS